MSFAVQELNLGRNNFCRFPTEIFAVTTLCHLDVRENSIDTIPPGISALKRLKVRFFGWFERVNLSRCLIVCAAESQHSG